MRWMNRKICGAPLLSASNKDNVNSDIIFTNPTCRSNLFNIQLVVLTVTIDTWRMTNNRLRASIAFDLS